MMEFENFFYRLHIFLERCVGTRKHFFVSSCLAALSHVAVRVQKQDFESESRSLFRSGVVARCLPMVFFEVRKIHEIVLWSVVWLKFCNRWLGGSYGTD